MGSYLVKFNQVCEQLNWSQGFYNDNLGKLKENERKTHRDMTKFRQDWQLNLDLKHEIIVSTK